MKLKRYLLEGLGDGQRKESNTGLGIDGLSKQRVKTLINKETKSCWYNKIYHDQYWQGPNCIWDTFDRLHINWVLGKTQYRHDERNIPSGKEWNFEIMWDDDKGKHQKLKGILIASGAGTVADPLSRYDIVLQIF